MRDKRAARFRGNDGRHRFVIIFHAMKRWTKNDNLNAGVIAPRIAGVMAVYNKPREFRMCLEGYRRQSFFIDHHQEFQLVVADDGSGPEIEEILSRFADEVSFPVTYLRQEDGGWGKLRMLNWSVLECRAERMIFTDGDCVPHRHFLSSHYEHSDPNTVYCGRRVDIMEELAGELTVEDIRGGKLESPWWIVRNILKGKTDFGEQGFYLPELLARLVPTFSKNSRPTLVGSNFSIRKKWLLDLNGFDETFTRPGYGEDTDLERRLGFPGVKLEWITYRAIQFHIWHPLTAVGEESKKIFESLKALGNKTALKGIKEFLPEYEKLTSDAAL